MLYDAYLSTIYEVSGNSTMLHTTQFT